MTHTERPAGRVAGGDAVVVLSRTSPRAWVDIVERDGRAEAIVWPGIGAQFRSLHRIDLFAGGRTVVLQHAGEAAYFVMAGGAEIVDEDTGQCSPLPLGSMVHIGPHRPYRIVATSATEIVGGPCPPDPSWYGDVAPTVEAAEPVAPGTIRVFHRDRPSHLLPLISSDARLVVWPGVGAEFANLNYVTMQPGEANTPHAHNTSEDTIYIVDGKGSIDDLTNDVRLEFEAGDVIHVPAGVRHAVRADRGESVVSCGGPCPPDRALFGHAVEVT